MLLSLTCCGSRSLNAKQADIINSSSLYDPFSVTTLENEKYQFKEGALKGSGRKWYSQFAFTRALTVGKNK